MDQFSVEIPQTLSHFMDNAILRLSYLYPNLEFSAQANMITVEGNIENIEALRKEITYLIYREKVYDDYLPIRKKIYEDI